MLYVRSYFLALLVFLVIDAIWLGFVANSFYFDQLGDLVADEINYAVAGLFYLLYVFGVTVLVIAPALEKRSGFEAAWKGALFGLVAYATYDLTNLATIRDWPLLMSMVDIVWGAALTMTTAWGGYQLTMLTGAPKPAGAAAAKPS